MFIKRNPREEKLVFRGKISSKVKAYAYYLRAEGSLSYRKISKRCNILASSVVRICKKAKTAKEIKEQKRRTGRPSLMSRREKKQFIRTFQKLRDEKPNVTVRDVANECRFVNVSYRTLVTLMNQNGYRSLRPRQKGLLSIKDRRRRERSPEMLLKNMTANSGWTTSSIWMVCLSFTSKMHIKTL